MLVGTSQSVKEISFFWASSLPNIFSPFSKNVPGLLRLNTARSVGKNKHKVIYC